MSQNRSFNVSLTLKPGQTQKAPTGLSLDTNVFSYHVSCVVHPAFHDPNAGNNQHDESIK